VRALRMGMLLKSRLKTLALVAACVVLTTPLHAEDVTPGSCEVVDKPIMGRHCMLTRQIEDTRVGGDRAGGVLRAEAFGNTVAPDVRMAVLSARAHMVKMASDADDEGVLLGPVGSAGGAPVFARLLGFLIVFALLSGDSSEPPLFGPPLSPS